MIRFKTSEETRAGDVARTLDDLYAETGEPVSARQIGDVVGMQPPQTLIYLHQAKDAGLAKSRPNQQSQLDVRLGPRICSRASIAILNTVPS